MNKENLLILADGLEDIELIHFDMVEYRDGEIEMHLPNNDCGSIGCALGWAPKIKGLEAIDIDVDSDKDFSFSKYCDRVLELPNESEEWDWCFSADWTDIDNTPYGASLRIRELAETGLPTYSYTQMIGEIPYQFEDQVKAFYERKSERELRRNS